MASKKTGSGKNHTPRPTGQYKSADTGRFVTPKFAVKHPKTTYKLGR